MSFLRPNAGNRLQPERRSGVRILTLKNAGWLALLLVILYFVLARFM